LFIEDAPAVDLVHAVHQQSERNGLLSVGRYRQQFFSMEGTVTEILARIRYRAYFVSGQNFSFPLCHNFLRLV
jgi:hypothetical protein